MKNIYKLFLLILIVACSKDATIYNQPYILNIPSHFPKTNFINNALTINGVALGKLLFYDKNLSVNQNISCASCHAPKYAFADSGKSFSIGSLNNLGSRNSPAIINMLFVPNYFWDGGVPNLESTSLVPLTSTHEMANNLNNIVNYLNANKMYTQKFAELFGMQKINTAMLLNVLAQFQNSIISCNSKFDNWLQNKITFTDLELQGYNLFINPQKGNCNTCHNLQNTSTDNLFHNIGLDSTITDVGRYRITLISSDSGKFKTPTLRNLSYTTPYMHDGRFSNLKQVLEFYNSNFFTNNNVDSNIKKFSKNRLTTQDLQALESFLLTLNDTSFVNNILYK